SLGSAQRCGYGYDEGVGSFHFGRGAQLSTFDHAANQRIEIGLAKMGTSLIDGVHDGLVNIDPKDRKTVLRKHRCGRQSNVSKADDRNPLETVHLVRTSTMRSAAWPSPYGLCARLMAPYAASSSSKRVARRKSRSGSVPTSSPVPASTASGRSVVSRVTSTGLPSDGASSCTPPESVMIKLARRIICTKGK